MSKKKQRKIHFEDFLIDCGDEGIWYSCEYYKATKWDLQHPSYHKSAVIYQWYYCKFISGNDNAIETIKSHKDRLKKKKEKAEREGLIRNDYDRFFYRFWEELLEYALECKIGDEEGY